MVRLALASAALEEGELHGAVRADAGGARHDLRGRQPRADVAVALAQVDGALVPVGRRLASRTVGRPAARPPIN